MYLPQFCLHFRLQIHTFFSSTLEESDMGTVIKLTLKGYIRGVPHTAYYSWPTGTTKANVDALIISFKKAFDNISAILEYAYLDL